MEKLASKNKEIARKFWEAVWEERNLDHAREFISEKIAYHSPRIEIKGKKKYFEFIEGYMNVFDDTRLMFEDQIAENNKVFTKVVFSGIHSGDFGEIPPTHKRIEFSLMNLLQINKGKITKEWEIFDELGFMQQLGMEPVMQGPAH